MKYNIKTHGDFKKYYDTTQKRNIWVLGYFGGGSINIYEALGLAKQYSDATNVPIETVMMDEILHSRRFKHFKYIYSQEKRMPESDADQMENVFKWLTD